MWHHAVSKMVIAARVGLRPIDGPFGDFNDPDGYKAQANRSATLGCEVNGLYIQVKLILLMK